MPLPREHLLDDLATAYLQAITAAAGATIAVSRREYGVDGALRHIVKIGADGYAESGVSVDFQLKGTAAVSMDPGVFVYDLKARNYNLLAVRPRATPYYLFVVSFEEEAQRWIVEEPERLILSAKAFWWMSPGVRSDNVSTVRIRIPLAQKLTVKVMQQIIAFARSRVIE